MGAVLVKYNFILTLQFFYFLIKIIFIQFIKNEKQIVLNNVLLILLFIVLNLFIDKDFLILP